ncbi:MAG: hypothetical protein ISS56_15965 [Anaerolineae bacterium]|nr:hypothetical protein [Anaerolineae bacterium]
MAVKRKQRVLLVVANLTTHGREELKWLYQWLDANALNVATVMLGALYRRVYTLTGEEVTAANLVEQLETLAADPKTKAIDVLINLHGWTGKLWFVEGPVIVKDLADLIAGKHLERKLRLLYSTACYGATHAPDLVRAGFRVASGAVGVNANGAHDYPTQLLYWAMGATYKSALAAGNNKLITAVYDELARKFDFEDVNSVKIAVGKKKTTITSSAT